MEWGTVISISGVLLVAGVWLFEKFDVIRVRWFGASSLFSDPYYRLKSVEEIAAAAAAGLKIDVNQASVDDWLRLPGLSIHQARTLVELTQAGIQLHSLEDIAAVLGLPLQRLKPLEPVLLFCYYDTPVALQPLNPNTATADALQRIPGVDLYLARAIVQNRVQGPYRNLVHLQRRLSLSSQVTAELMHYLKF
ncbi:ComEA family DNA-binding protein [Kovacikia minuta]|uniref:ComEA family DNA-binding protein n=1 Tax=Kovacikia minuta TaxID=2931930 RepID=UPI001CEDF862|nr:ComEA family DNA-binding protein [Kovacikia minuta]